jgi:hypothetical protein
VPLPRFSLRKTLERLAAATAPAPREVSVPTRITEPYRGVEGAPPVQFGLDKVGERLQWVPRGEEDAVAYEGTYVPTQVPESLLGAIEPLTRTVTAPSPLEAEPLSTPSALRKLMARTGVEDVDAAEPIDQWRIRELSDATAAQQKQLRSAELADDMARTSQTPISQSGSSYAGKQARKAAYARTIRALQGKHTPTTDVGSHVRRRLPTDPLTEAEKVEMLAAAQRAIKGDRSTALPRQEWISASDAVGEEVDPVPLVSLKTPEQRLAAFQRYANPPRQDVEEALPWTSIRHGETLLVEEKLPTGGTRSFRMTATSPAEVAALIAGDANWNATAVPRAATFAQARRAATEAEQAQLLLSAYDQLVRPRQSPAEVDALRSGEQTAVRTSLPASVEKATFWERPSAGGRALELPLGERLDPTQQDLTAATGLTQQALELLAGGGKQQWRLVAGAVPPPLRPEAPVVRPQVQPDKLPLHPGARSLVAAEAAPDSVEGAFYTGFGEPFAGKLPLLGYSGKAQSEGEWLQQPIWGGRGVPTHRSTAVAGAKKRTTASRGVSNKAAIAQSQVVIAMGVKLDGKGSPVMPRFPDEPGATTQYAVREAQKRNIPVVLNPTMEELAVAMLRVPAGGKAFVIGRMGEQAAASMATGARELMVQTPGRTGAARARILELLTPTIQAIRQFVGPTEDSAVGLVHAFLRGALTEKQLKQLPPELQGGAIPAGLELLTTGGSHPAPAPFALVDNSIAFGRLPSGDLVVVQPRATVRSTGAGRTAATPPFLALRREAAGAVPRDRALPPTATAVRLQPLTGEWDLIGIQPSGYGVARNRLTGKLSTEWDLSKVQGLELPRSSAVGRLAPRDRVRLPDGREGNVVRDVATMVRPNEKTGQPDTLRRGVAPRVETTYIRDIHSPEKTAFIGTPAEWAALPREIPEKGSFHVFPTVEVAQRALLAIDAVGATDDAPRLSKSWNFLVGPSQEKAARAAFPEQQPALTPTAASQRLGVQPLVAIEASAPGRPPVQPPVRPQPAAPAPTDPLEQVALLRELAAMREKAAGVPTAAIANRIDALTGRLQQLAATGQTRADVAAPAPSREPVRQPPASSVVEQLPYSQLQKLPTAPISPEVLPDVEAIGGFGPTQLVTEAADIATRDPRFQAFTPAEMSGGARATAASDLLAVKALQDATPGLPAAAAQRQLQDARIAEHQRMLTLDGDLLGPLPAGELPVKLTVWRKGKALPMSTSAVLAQIKLAAFRAAAGSEQAARLVQRYLRYVDLRESAEAGRQQPAAPAVTKRGLRQRPGAPQPRGSFTKALDRIAATPPVAPRPQRVEGSAPPEAYLSPLLPRLSQLEVLQAQAEGMAAAATSAGKRFIAEEPAYVFGGPKESADPATPTTTDWDEVRHISDFLTNKLVAPLVLGLVGSLMPEWTEDAEAGILKHTPKVPDAAATRQLQLQPVGRAPVRKLDSAIDVLDNENHFLELALGDTEKIWDFRRRMAQAEQRSETFKRDMQVLFARFGDDPLLEEAMNVGRREQVYLERAWELQKLQQQLASLPPNSDEQVGRQLSNRISTLQRRLASGEVSPYGALPSEVEALKQQLLQKPRGAEALDYYRAVIQPTYQRNMLELLGPLESSEVLQDWMQMAWFPAHRRQDFDPKTGSLLPQALGLGGSVRNPAESSIREAEGSQLELVHPVEDMLLQFRQTSQERAAADVTQMVTETLLAQGPAVARVVDPYLPQPPRMGFGTVSYKQGGKKVTVEVPYTVKTVLESPKGLQKMAISQALAQQGMDGVLPKVKAIGNIAVTGAGAGFALKQLWSDNMAAMTQVDYGTRVVAPVRRYLAEFWKAYTTELGYVFHKDREWSPQRRAENNAGLYMGGYGGLSAGDNSQAPTGIAALDLPYKAVSGIATYLTTPLEVAQKAATVRTLGAAFPERTLEALVSEARAMGGTPDFNIRGRAFKSDTSNLLTQFLPAQIRVIGQAIEAIVDPRKGALRTRQAAATITTVLAGQHLWNLAIMGADAYLRVDVAPGEMVWAVPGTTETLEDGRERPLLLRFMLPKAMALLVSPIEEGFAAALGRKTWGQAALATASNFLPGSTELKTNDLLRTTASRALSTTMPYVRSPLEAAMDWNTVTGTPLEGARLEQRLATDRVTSRTSPTAKALSRLLASATTPPGEAPMESLSPIMLQHGMNMVLPGVLSAPVAATDMLLARPGSLLGSSKQEALRRLVAPARAMTANELDAESERIRDRFYEVYNDMRQGKVSQGLKGRSNTPREMTAALVAGKQRFDALAGAMSTLITKKRALDEGPALPPEERLKRLRAIGAQQRQLLQQMDAAVTSRTTRLQSQR